jgi:hypothetical protein
MLRQTCRLHGMYALHACAEHKFFGCPSIINHSFITSAYTLCQRLVHRTLQHQTIKKRNDDVTLSHNMLQQGNFATFRRSRGLVTSSIQIRGRCRLFYFILCHFFLNHATSVQRLEISQFMSLTPLKETARNEMRSNS